MSRESGLLWRPRHVLVYVLASLCLAAGSFLWVRMQDGRWISHSEHEVFLSISALSQMMSNWLVYDTDRQYERVSSAAEAMLLGDYLYVSVTHLGDVMIDARSPAWEDMDPSERGFKDATVSPHQVTARKLGGDLVIEAVAPLPGLDPEANYVRVGVRDESLRIHLRNSRLAIGAGAFAVWVIVTALGLVLSRRTASRQEVPPEPSEAPVASRDIIEYGSLRIHRTRKTVELADRRLELPPKLYHLLELLASEPDQAYEAKEILKRIWADAQYASANDVRQSIYRLRKRLNDLEPGLGETIINVKGFGYRFDLTKVPVKSSP